MRSELVLGIDDDLTSLDPQPEIFPLSDVGLVKGEILALLTCTCMRVGKSCPPSVTEISSQIATGCSCF